MRTGALLKKLKAEGKTAFIPYITAGDPTLEATREFVHALIEAGAAVIELGVPFSDPMADGPVNQRSAERALKNGVSLKDTLGLVKRLRGEGVTLPLVLFTYFNPIYKMGVKQFAAEAKNAGVTAVLALDLPPEEASEYRKLMAGAGVETVFLAAPTSDDERLRVIDEASTGFVYYVSRTGVTGAQAQVSGSLEAEFKRVRAQVENPVAVGFGISRPEHARQVAAIADGVVVGSAIVQLIEKNSDPKRAREEIREFARSLVQAIQEK